MLPRHLAPRLLRDASQYPVITLTGPRQSGKTTLVRSLFEDTRYVSLETPSERRHALGSGLRETAFYLRIQQQPSRCLPAFHYTKQRLGPEPVSDQRKGKLQLQVGQRLANRLGQARANDRQMCPAIGHGQTQRPWLAAVLEDRCDSGLLVRVAVPQNG